MNHLPDPLRNARRRAGDLASSARDKAQESLGRAQVQARTRIDEGREALVHAGAQARDGLARSQVEVSSFVRRHPLATIAGAVTLGVVVGALWPRGGEVSADVDDEDITGV